MNDHMTHTQLFADQIAEKLRAMLLPYRDLTARDIHMECGGYPGSSHNMPQCCDAMYRMMAGDDRVLASPKKGKGASLTIRYYRRNHL